MSPRTLRGIALALDLTLSVVREVAWADGGQPRPFRLPNRAEKLGDPQRREVLALIDRLIEAQEAIEQPMESCNQEVEGIPAR